MSKQNSNFTTLQWYDEAIKFIFNFAAKTSELLLAAGVVVSTANFLTDGSVMQTHSTIYNAWSWAQALAIDSSLGIAFMDGFQAVREREKIKAAIFFFLTAILAIVAGLLTDFDSLSHASGLPLKDVSSTIPLWILSALRAVAVIGFLLTSRLKNFSFNGLHQELVQKPQPEPAQVAVQSIDYQTLAKELAPLLQAVRMTIIEEVKASIGESASMPVIGTRTSAAQDQELAPGKSLPLNKRHLPGSAPEMSTTDTMSESVPVIEVKPSATQEEKLESAYQELLHENNGKRISGRALSERAKIRRTTCTYWLNVTHPENDAASAIGEKITDQGERHHQDDELDSAPKTSATNA